jgi:hypothetical protein
VDALQKVRRRGDLWTTPREESRAWPDRSYGKPLTQEGEVYGSLLSKAEFSVASVAESSSNGEVVERMAEKAK